MTYPLSILGILVLCWHDLLRSWFGGVHHDCTVGIHVGGGHFLHHLGLLRGLLRGRARTLATPSSHGAATPSMATRGWSTTPSVGGRILGETIGVLLLLWGWRLHARVVLHVGVMLHATPTTVHAPVATTLTSRHAPLWGWPHLHPLGRHHLLWRLLLLRRWSLVLMLHASPTPTTPPNTPTVAPSREVLWQLLWVLELILWRPHLLWLILVVLLWWWGPLHMLLHLRWRHLTWRRPRHPWGFHHQLAHHADVLSLALHLLHLRARHHDTFGPFDNTRTLLHARWAAKGHPWLLHGWASTLHGPDVGADGPWLLEGRGPTCDTGTGGQVHIGELLSIFIWNRQCET